MVQQLSQTVIYPESDGQPMAENTQQFQWIVVIKENLEILFAHRPDVFVAGDLLWYPVEGDNKTRQAPDAMVAIGRPKGHRGSYRQWEEDNIAPQVVFEIVSPGNRLAEMNRKLRFYERYGVEEYYIYDPERWDLAGWLRGEGGLEMIEEMEGWVSPRLQIRFECQPTGLELYYPDGRRFLTSIELQQQAEAAQRQAEAAQGQAEAAQRQAEAAQQQAEAAQRQAEESEQRARRVEEELAAEKVRSQRLAEQLKRLGIDPD
ncbi:Uma2 family endonuclease [Spirulina subsalsa FACHB-351]|uniref:Uma2 family endonuclease n=1 Tax=Spirulina subsalsa FACHB-351 TaxID=234711 RepID=A0ABT3LC36_9CYAN|nr:Uma2 family endonuclease [Spirulina subsalsa]MCW6038697.1 Uma2 family endonuclease [Spirulina subsalsa FACHB-351]